MTLQELTTIVTETMIQTEDDIQHYSELAAKLVAVTIQVMNCLKDLSVEMSTRDLNDALVVQQIVAKVREREEQERG